MINVEHIQHLKSQAVMADGGGGGKITFIGNNFYASGFSHPQISL